MTPYTHIGGKNIYVVEGHNRVIHAWAEVRAQVGFPPILITIDYHADTMPAFNAAICADRAIPWGGNVMLKSREYCSEVGLKSGRAPAGCSNRLKNDEHIDAAIAAEIISHAFVISFQAGDTCRRKTKANAEEQASFILKHGRDKSLEDCSYTAFDLPYNRIYELEPTCSPNCDENGHIDCERRQADAALEALYLAPKIQDIIEMGELAGIGNVLAKSFILDVDLDFFRSKKAIEPNNPNEFYNLVRQACAITIATEPSYVKSCALPGEEMEAGWLLTRLLNHFGAALC